MVNLAPTHIVSIDAITTVMLYLIKVKLTNKLDTAKSLEDAVSIEPNGSIDAINDMAMMRNTSFDTINTPLHKHNKIKQISKFFCNICI